MRDEAERERNERILLSAAIQIVQRRGVSSLHITFPTEAEWKFLSDLGLLARTDRIEPGDVVAVTCPVERVNAVIAALGDRSPSRRFAGEVGTHHESM